MITLRNHEYVTFRYKGGRVNDIVACMDLQGAILMVKDRLFLRNRDKKGRFCAPVLTDANGEVVCTTPRAKSGMIDFDGSYDSYYSTRVSDCDENERLLLNKFGYAVEEDN